MHSSALHHNKRQHAQVPSAPIASSLEVHRCHEGQVCLAIRVHAQCAATMLHLRLRLAMDGCHPLETSLPMNRDGQGQKHRHHWCNVTR
jgi:hypothetical protein